MPEVVDGIAGDIRKQAREAKIATLDAAQFWTSIKPFMGPEQLLPVVGVKSENASVAKPDEDVINWHHYELGETYALPYHWDRYIFRLVCYMETNLIHESVKQRIFDMTKIEALCTGIRNEIKDYRQVTGVGPIGEIPESIIPTKTSYREATSPSPKREKVKIEQSGNANAKPPSEMEVEPSGNADESQTSALDDALGENADADVSEATKAEHEEKRIDKIMSYVTEVYQPDPSKLIVKGSRQ